MKNNISNDYGYCHYCVCNEKDCSMIYNLYVEKEYRRKGHAKDLVQKSIDKIREHGYEGNIKVIAIPEEDSISKKDLTEFYIKMGLEISDYE